MVLSNFTCLNAVVVTYLSLLREKSSIKFMNLIISENIRKYVV